MAGSDVDPARILALLIAIFLSTQICLALLRAFFGVVKAMCWVAVYVALMAVVIQLAGIWDFCDPLVRAFEEVMKVDKNYLLTQARNYTLQLFGSSTDYQHLLFEQLKKPAK